MTAGRGIKYLFLFLSFCAFTYVKAQVVIEEAFPSLTFESPVDLQNAGDASNRLFVVEQDGIIRVFDNTSDVTESRVFLDIRDRIVSGGEMGLLGLAFHPDFENNGYFYVNYTKPFPIHTHISRFSVTANPDSADSSSEQILLTFSQPFQNHNGGQIAFGPDGYLYIATGDGGSAGDPDNNAQNKNSFLGKILRIDVNNKQDSLQYSIPADNPFSTMDSVKKEIFAYGLRNPWRFSFDSSGRLWAADVGQDYWEEIDIITKGGNYGWKILEGNHCYITSTCDTSGLIPPVHEYYHNSSGGFSVTGGYVYEGNAVPYLADKYIFADYVSKRIWSLDPDSGNKVELIATAEAGIPSFGKDENNEIYFTSFDGKIYKFRDINTGIEENPGLNNNYILNQNYPNPFNPTTKMEYYIPEESSVKIEIINTNGELVATLTREIKQQGHYQSVWNAGDLASGVYYARMNAVSISSGKSITRVLKLMLMK